MKRAQGLGASLALLVTCGPSAPPGPTPAEAADGAALQRLLTDRAYAEALAPAEEAVAADLPVRAAERLREATLPAARAQLARLGAFSPASPAGRRATAKARDALQARMEALETYAAALERGLVEDLVLVDALRDMRVAENAIDAALGEAAALRGAREARPHGAEPRPATHDTPAAPATRPATPR
ncbi:MAG: hypothetical protein AAF447_28115 [Myxococcota bacterium]